MAAGNSRRTVALRSVQALSPTVKGFEWECVDGEPLSYVAGQWLNFDVPTSQGVIRRAYSIASAPLSDRQTIFETAITRIDQGAIASQALHALTPGARLEIDGPHGFFTREQAAHLPALFVATGTGLCPLRAMLEEELRDPGGPHLSLLFGCRTEADILWKAQLQDWAATHARFSLHVTLSRPSETWRGLAGYVQQHLAGLIDPEQRPQVYVCGLTKMVGEVRQTLKQNLGYDRRSIHSERYD